jgi:molecular chaperone HscB
MDAFDVLALAPVFDLEASELERRYRDLQKQLHPDKFVQASASEKRASLARAVGVNDAYRALRDELKRAEILFARFGGQTGEREQANDPELLMEVMELRENLAEAKASRDMKAVQALHTEVKGREASAKDGLRRAFAALQTERNQALLSDAGRALARLRYYRRFQDEVARFEEEALG